MSHRTALTRARDGTRGALPGNRIRILYDGLHTDGAYALVEFEFAAGLSVPVAH